MPLKSVVHKDLPLLVIGTLIDIGTRRGSSHDAINWYTKQCSISDRDAGREGDPEICFYPVESNQVILW